MQLASSTRSEHADLQSCNTGRAWLRKDERWTRLICSSVLVYQAQLFELAYLVTH
jgi:hypothetical protein